jgi:N-ethylmaleimide reductase
MSRVFDPMTLGALSLRNRIVMAPMTRSRAGAGDAPTALNVDYYRQRAAAGLIVAEGTQPSPHGKGYCRTPGIHSPEQIAGWRQVTDAVHTAGGAIALQIMHCGRVGSHHNKDADAETVAPSAIQAKGQVFTDAVGMADLDMPRALASAEIPGLIDEFKQAALNARAAGFDGVELHVASGYLPMQFLSTGTNHRTDGYGGSLNHRLRFVVETLEAMSAAVGPDRVGFRICPGNPFNDMHDDDPTETYTALIQAVDHLGLAYLHMIRSPIKTLDIFAIARRHFRGALIINENFDAAKGDQALADGIGDAVSYGRHFIGNPDLVERFRHQQPLAGFDLKSLYTPGPQGYTDYPTFENTEK